MGPKMSVIFVPYSREFVITVIVITEFDCIVIHMVPKYCSAQELSLYGIFWLFVSLLHCQKVIIISGGHCIIKSSMFSAVREPHGVGEEPSGHVLAVVLAQRQQRQQLAHQHPREANAQELSGKPSKEFDHTRGNNISTLTIFKN